MTTRYLAILLLPVCTALAQRTEVAFIANSADGTVAVLDIATRTVIGRIDINPGRVKATGPGAANYVQDTDISPDGQTLYVSRGYLGDVAAFDVVTKELLWKTPLNTGRADHMTLSPDGRSLFVSAMFDNRVYRIDTRTGGIMGHVVTGVYPHDNKISPDGRLLYNTSIGPLSGMPRPANAPPLTDTAGAPFQVTIVDAKTFEVRDRIRTAEAIRPWDFAPGATGMYAQVANKHEVVFFDLRTRSITRRLELPVKPGITASDYDFEAPHHGLSLTDDGRTLCLSSRASDYVALVDAREMKLRSVIPVGDGPGWAEVADSGRLCLVTNTRSDDLSIISIAEQKELARIPIGDGPKHVTVARIPERTVNAIRQRSHQRLVLGRAERDLTGDGKPESLMLWATGPSIDSLEVTLWISSNAKTIYQQRLSTITRRIGYDGTREMRTAEQQRQFVADYGAWFFDSKKFVTPTDFARNWNRQAPAQLTEIPATIARDGGFATDTARGRAIWKEIQRRDLTIFEYSPGGDAVTAIAWSAKDRKFFHLVECC